MTDSRAKAMWAITLTYAAALAVVTLLPSGTGALKGWDAAFSPKLQNLLHVPAYAALMILASAAVLMSSQAALPRITWVGLGCGLFGMASEFAQTVIPGRMGSILDALLNTAGIGVGFAAVFLWKGFSKRPLFNVEVM